MNRSFLLSLVLCGISPALCFIAQPAADCKDSLANHGLYTASDLPGVVLFDNPSAYRTRRAYLTIDNNGKPALYVCQKVASQNSNKLDHCSRTDLSKLWRCEDSNLVSIALSGWTLADHKWNTFFIDLKFDDSHCTAFKVTGPGISFMDWIPATEIPDRVVTSKSKIPLPVEIVCVEGPSDLSDCGRFNP